MMTHPVTSVKLDGQNDAGSHRATKSSPNPQRAARPPDARYTYASGERPLEGYTIKRGLGHGGFGEVYFATSDAGKEVALKLIRRNLDIELRGIRQCLNLKHPDLLAIFDIREDQRGDHWVVMEYVGGDSLEDVVAAYPDGMSIAETLAWIHGIGAAVAYLHDHGIVHRDLKPGNIFSDEGVVKIGDYGLSKFISCSRRSGQTESVGTVHYMAPEVANGRYGKEIDIYALGIMLYEMLIGRVPFEGESVGEVLMKHLTAEPDVTHLAEPYRGVVARALQKDPAKRFSSVEAMLSALPHPEKGVRNLLPSGGTPGAPGASSDRREERPSSGSPFSRSDEEPILAAIRRGVKYTWSAWKQSELNTPAKIVLTLVAIWLLLDLVPAAIALAMFLVPIYVVYWIVRSIVIATRGGNGKGDSPIFAETKMGTVPNLQSPIPNPQSPRPHQRRWRGQERPADALVLKPPRERLAELLGSMLGSTLVAAVVSLVVVTVGAAHGQMSPRPEQFAWLLVVSVAAAWTVLILSKFWEGADGDAVLRRFVTMVAGLALGVAAFGLAVLLQVDLPYGKGFGRVFLVRLPATFYQDGTPLVLAHMAAFGTLFLAIRWWRQANPLRSTRLSLFSLAFCVGMAWFVAGLWRYPQPWLMMVALTTATAVQLSAPWIPPRRRKRDYTP